MNVNAGAQSLTAADRKKKVGYVAYVGKVMNLF